MMNKITSKEYGAFYKGYVERFEQKDILIELASQITDFKNLFKDKSDKSVVYRYAESKWSIGEVILHISDAERVFAYRAMSIARGEEQSLQGFDQDQYVINSKANQRSLQSLMDEFVAIRASTISLFSSFDDTTLQICGAANGHPASVRALGYIILGHCDHHLKILTERYFV